MFSLLPKYLTQPFQKNPPLLQALQDARWRPETPEQRQATGVAIGAGMSCTTDMAEAGVLIVSAHWVKSDSRPFIRQL